MAHTMPTRHRGWRDLVGGLAIIGLVVGGGYYSYQWLMGDLPEGRSLWPALGLLAGCVVGPVLSTLLGKDPGSGRNLAFGVFAGALAGIAIAGALSWL